MDLSRLKDFLGLERNVVLAASADFFLGFGEELWNKFLPKYLEALGAGVLAIGLFGAVKNFFDAVYQYPGGWLADRLGRRHALQIFLGLASLGYLIYFVSPSWPFVFLGLALAMAWTSMASPAVFAVIGDALPKNRRAMGFTIQSLVKRIPRALAPLVGPEPDRPVRALKYYLKATADLLMHKGRTDLVIPFHGTSRITPPAAVSSSPVITSTAKLACESMSSRMSRITCPALAPLS